VHFEATINYPATVPASAAMLADEGFLQRRLAAAGASESRIDVARDGDAFTVSMATRLPTDDVPASFRSFVGASLEVRIVEAWEAPLATGERRGTIAVDIAGAPVAVSGHMRLVTDGAGARHDVRGEVRASVPLFGRAIEEAASSAVQSVLTGQERVAREHLADSAG